MEMSGSASVETEYRVHAVIVADTTTRNLARKYT